MSYSTINMNKFPGEMRVPGKTLIQQIKNTGDQDVLRGIQEMRNEEYAKEVKRGEFTPEFGGFSLGDISSSIQLLKPTLPTSLKTWLIAIYGALFVPVLLQILGTNHLLPHILEHRSQDRLNTPTLIGAVLIGFTIAANLNL